MRISKTFTFEAAHRLIRHEGKCRHLHGHSYKVEVEIAGPELQQEGSQTGMLLDFGIVKEWWQTQEHKYDHVTILEASDPLVNALDGLVPFTLMPWPPTAEHIAEVLQGSLLAWIRKQVIKEAEVRVKVYETANSYAQTDWAEV